MAELTAQMQALNMGKKKKRPQRAFHETAFTPLVETPVPDANSYANTNTANYTGYDNFNKSENDDTSDISLSAARYINLLEYAVPGKSFLTFQNVIPPMAGTQFHTIDQATASSKYMRPTMYNVPENEHLRAATKLPMSVTIRPFAPLLDTETPVPVVDMLTLGVSESTDPMDHGPPRCRRCRTYMNPSMQHTNHGTFLCNICQFPNNSVPMDYSSLLNPSTGQRVDRDLRPELHSGVYDIIVPPQYNARGPTSANHELHHVFLIDITEQSIKHMLPTLVADAIRATLYSFDQEEETVFQGKIAIICFDKRLKFYNLSSALDSTQISIAADLDDPFVPFNEGLFANPEESRLAIEDALNSLEAYNNHDVVADSEPCFAAACRYAKECLAQVGGGKITSVLSILPSWGPGGLKYKDNRAVGRMPNPELEKSIYSPDSEYYKLLAKDFLAENVGLDVFVVSPLSVDLSNIGWLANVSGGTVYKWSNFNLERDGRHFTAKFVGSVTKATGYQGQLKLRCSNGLQVAQYYGTSSAIADATLAGSVNDPVVPVLSEDQAFTVLLLYDGNLNTKYDCHFQTALLYTDKLGIRKVRVINLVLAVSERLEDVFNFVDQDAVVTTIVRDTLSFVGKQPLRELRDSINEKLVQVFTQYRAMSEFGHNRNRILNNQLIFPESLKHLPLYLLGFLKTKAIRESSTITADTRLNEIYQLLTMPVERLVYMLYPALVEMHSLAEDEGLIDESEANPHRFIKLPEYKPLSASSMDYGVYIMCDGDRVYVWIHQNANIMLIKDLFGEEIEEVKGISPEMDEFPDLPTEISQQARNLVNFFQSHIIGTNSSIGQGGIHIIRQGIDNAEERFNELLVEDSLKGAIAVSSGPSYSDYLTSLHKAIRVKLDNDKSSNQVKDSVTTVETTDTLAQRLIHF